MIASAFLAFREAGIDIALVEVGMGGRWDATNASDPIVTVLTNVEHGPHAVPGRHPGGHRPGEALHRPARAGPWSWGPAWTRPGSGRSWNAAPCSIPRRPSGPQTLAWDHSLVEGHRIPLAGGHQMENLATALETLRRLGVPEGPAWRGIEGTLWPGRLWPVPGLAGVTVDGAHNLDGARRLADHALATAIHPHLYFAPWATRTWPACGTSSCAWTPPPSPWCGATTAATPPPRPSGPSGGPATRCWTSRRRPGGSGRVRPARGWCAGPFISSATSSGHWGSTPKGDTFDGSMSLSPGTFLGAYEILAPIGEGGMGEVYRARDPRLEREVAIKVLQQAVASDDRQLTRFRQEARAVALLNHPNILQIYDSGVQQGLPYIVMELLEGQSLRERIAGHPLGLRKALDIAIQVAHGLAVAHAKKIIHRDLKPENIFVEPDGRVKILDFGLAKLLEPASGDVDRTLEHRGAQGLTREGTLLGTAGYMSPEQVGGGLLDPRTDLFSLGIILVEMLTGRPPFRRATQVETLHAILKDEPGDLAPGLPPTLERTIRRCLEKDPRDRFQTASDLIFSLEGATLPSSSVILPRPSLRFRIPERARRWLLAAAVAVAGLLGFWAGNRTAARKPLVYHRLTYRKGVVQGARFTPDGQSFVFGLSIDGAPGRLFQGRTDGIGARLLELRPGHRDPFHLPLRGDGPPPPHPRPARRDPGPGPPFRRRAQGSAGACLRGRLGPQRPGSCGHPRG